LDEEHIMDDPKGDYVSNLEQEQRFRWKKRLYEQEKSKLLRDKWSVMVVPADIGRKIAVGSLVKRKKRPQWEGEVIEKVGKKWKVSSATTTILVLMIEFRACLLIFLFLFFHTTRCA
jgi:hypothetical protein